MNGGVPPRQGASQEDLQHVQAKLAEAGTAIPANFTPTAPSHVSADALLNWQLSAVANKLRQSQKSASSKADIC